MNLILLRVTFYFLLFLISGMLNYDKKVNLKQGFLTISVGLLILWFLALKGKLKELESWAFFIIYIVSIPLIFHLIYRLFFAEDVETSGRVDKLYILAIIMVYLSYVWYETRIKMK